MVKGHCDAQFLKLKSILEKQLNSNYELGASVSVEWQGREVVNLYGGFKDESKNCQWTEDTIVNVFSVTKAVSGICITKLIDDGLLDVDQNVSYYWPEYGCNGKENTKVIDFLTHRAGMFGFQDGIPKVPWSEWDIYVKALEKQKPFREPGVSQGYHAVTFAWLVGELIKRIDGRSTGEYFKEEFVNPLNLDFHIGLNEAEFSRCAEIGFKKLDSLKPPLDFIKYVPNFMLNKDLKNYKDSVVSKDFIEAFNSSHFDINNPNSKDWRTAEVPSANGHGTAKSLSKLFGVLSTGCERDGTKIMNPNVINKASKVVSNGPDTVLFGSKLNFGYCFMVEQNFDQKLNFVPIFNAKTFGHAGIGGSVAFGDLKNKLGYAFVCNRQQKMGKLYKTSNMITKALYEALG